MLKSMELDTTVAKMQYLLQLPPRSAVTVGVARVELEACTWAPRPPTEYSGNSSRV